MNVVLLGIMATAGVVALSILAVIPAFIEKTPPDAQAQTMMMLSFSIVNDEESDPLWCQDLAAILNKHQVRATVFATGKIAESDPDCISTLSRDHNLDIGSQTFSYRNLTSIPDYQEALAEVEQGKRAVDRAGNLDSRLFKAPYGSADDNIFSYLSRSGILADFSYHDHYNKYHDGIFLRFESRSYSGIHHATGFFYDNVETLNVPVIIIEFDSHAADIATIDNFISEVKAANGYGKDIGLVNASDLSGLELTARNQDGGGFS